LDPPQIGAEKSKEELKDGHSSSYFAGSVALERRAMDFQIANGSPDSPALK
jgi:hypothetical protein